MMDAFCGVRGKFMRNISLFALSFLLVTGFSGGQQNSPLLPDSLSDVQSAPVKVYTVGPGVTAPELLPLDLSPFPTEKCRNKVDGKVVFSLLVDEIGQPRNIMFLHPLGTDLDRYALKIVGTDRFNPGKYNGTPVVVGQSVEVGMHTCFVQTKNDAGQTTYSLKLLSQPIQKIGALPQPPKEALLTSGDISKLKFSYNGNPVNPVIDGISPPVPLINVEAKFSDAARQAKYQGTCMISLTVDRNGLPQDLRVVKPLNYGLTEESIEAVKKYRFKPAMKNGEPIPVSITIEVMFRLY
jgi:TonB family protein